MPANNRLSTIADTDLVRIAQVGSQEACNELVRRFRGAATMVARQIVRSEQSAEDVAQDALINAIQALPRLQEPEKFPGWLYAITRHRAQYVAIREARNVVTGDEDLDRMREHSSSDDETYLQDDPLDLLLIRERQEAVRTVLRDLAPDIQRVIYLFYYEQWTAVQIAAFLSLPLTTIKWRLHTGRRQVSSRISELLEEVYDVGSGCEQRGDAPSPPSVKDGGIGGACRANGQLSKRPAQ